MLIELFINGKKTVRDIPAGMTLLRLLRELGYVSVREGCQTGNCGICTVWVNGTPVLSCGYPAARAQGAQVTTLEGVQEEAAQFTAYLTAQGGEQCGFCMPGFIMTVLSLKRVLNGRVPTREEVNEYLKGNLCRCSGYEVHVRAVLKWLGGKA